MTVEELIAKWWGKRGGAERSNLSAFIPDLCEALELPRPGPAESGALGDYEYEGSVPGGSFRSLKASGSIDLYKRGCFVMEAKQSRLSDAEKATPDLFDPSETAPRAASGARYDRLMLDARRQAENYARNLPGDHPAAPFLIVCDVGRAFELYFDWSGNGRGYGFFPDKQSYRIELPDLRDELARDRLRAIWLDPVSIDPRLRAAEVTRGVARRLADVSRWLEEVQKQKTQGLSSYERSLAVEESALFLMRLLFCMFAEDIGLLPKDKFKAFLERSIDNEKLFPNGLADLWQKMGSPSPPNRFAHVLEDDVRYFNGGLFSEQATTYSLDRSSIGELYQAAKADWRRVEPAIFGTLLEQALTPEERSKLGAHYTPRPYVERLVQATIMDVVEAEWLAIEELDEAAILPAALAFHDRLAALRVLDPARGTGNFLYVAMELLQGLESKVIDLIQKAGGDARSRVGPHQFFGLELNPRAARIAELVLWIGWLRNRLHDDPDAVPEPVLAESASINFGKPGGYDAVLARDEVGEIAQPPRQPAWPEAEFIVGNPPFIGKGAAMRGALGSDYVEALWTAYPEMPGSADFVMFWWDRAAAKLTGNGSMLRRFGLVTTNSITGTFNRRVVSRHLGDSAASLVFAVPDHPWTKAGKDAAAVRIAMTVVESGERDGQVVRVMAESGLATDTPQLGTASALGRINADLTIGSDVGAIKELKANRGLSANGMLLAGRGFVLSQAEAEQMIRRDGPASADVIRPYIGGSEMVQSPKRRFVIDLFGLSEKEARQRFPATYQHLLATVKPVRDTNNRNSYRNLWWIFAEPRREVRPSMVGLPRYIATVETSKHRIFSFIDGRVVPDHMVIAIAADDAFALGVLSSRLHSLWALRTGGTLEDRPRYNKSKIFDPFPFPDPTPDQRAAIADLGEELDATRKAALAEHPRLTMTGLYNLVEKLRAGAALTPAEETDARDARARIVLQIHDQLDAAVAAAYGWEWPMALAEIVARLVALNAERAAEEAAGHVRWLRPDYQVPRFGKAGDRA